MAKVILAPAARNDLAEIRRYISMELRNPSSANRIVATISTELHSLQKFPEMGAVLDIRVGAHSYRYLCAVTT